VTQNFVDCNTANYHHQQPKPSPIAAVLRMLFVFGCSNARCRSVLLAHVGAGFRVSIIPVVAKMINLGPSVRPDDGISGTVSLGRNFA
jgi:hypothetical protein